MRRVIRRALGVGGFVLLFAAAAGSADAAVPAGPRLAYVKFGLSPQRLELVTVDASGALPLRVAGGGLRTRPLPYLTAPSWSRDGSLIAFSGLLGAERREGEGPRLQMFVVAADGSGLRKVPGTDGAFYPVFSPDGHTIAFARQRQRHRPNENGGEDLVYESVSVWLADLAGGAPRRITPWRNRLRQTPSSFSPDGSVLAITRAAGDRGSEAVGLKLDGSPPSVLARNAFDPVYSPDGSRVAFLRGPRRTFRERNGTTTATFTDLYAMSASGGEAIQLTRTPRTVELMPSWDPSGQRLAYVEMMPLRSESSLLGFGNSIMQINPDGSCRSKLLSFPRVALFGPAWQPGPGREAGRIEC